VGSGAAVQTTKRGESMNRDELALEQARITGEIDGIVGKQLNQTQFLLLVNQFREWDKNQEQIQEASNG
jgi:hypothetical protein